MKILLDECIDQRFATEITGHEVKTVPKAGWGGLKNGQLLTRAQADFEILLTVDRNLPFKQDLPKYAIAVVVLRAQSNRLADLRPLIPELLKVLPTAPVGAAMVVEL